MVRIEGRRGKPAGPVRSGETASPKAIGNARGNFDKELKERDEAYSRQRLQELLGEIDAAAERLAKSLDLRDLLRYRQMVREFLREATNRAYLLREERGMSRRGASSCLVTVRTVDAEVEELIRSFTSKKKAPDEILAALDKIRGLLVDLLS